MRRVAITGVGAICALGRNAAEFAESLRQGRCGIGPIESTDMLATALSERRRGARLQPPAVFRRPPRRFHGPLRAVRRDRRARGGGCAGIEWTPELRENAAIVTGSCVGGQTAQDAGFREVYKLGHNRVHPLTIPRTMANAGASHISMEFGITGPSFTISTACSSAGHAIGQAFWMVRTGAADLAITGGSEAPFSFGILKAWEAMRVVSPDTCRPFSKDRRGMILGEGARHVRAGAARCRAGPRRAHPRGNRRLRHVGRRLPHHPALADGAARAMRAALRDAGLAPEQIGYINAHGTATPANDPTETAAIRAVFGAHADRLAVSSTKSMHGHALGAAAALECLAAVLALRDGMLPPTANYSEPDPECDLDVIPNQARAAQVEYALSNSFAFGGLNAVLALRKG